MNVQKLRTAEDWAAYYRHQLGLVVTERGGFLMLPITEHVRVIHLPTDRAERTRAAVAEQDLLGPLLARHIRWSFLVVPDSRPGPQILAELQRRNIGLPAIGGAVMLPTGLTRWTREGCFWVNPPQRGQTLPPLSMLITTALSVGASPLTTCD